MIHWLLQSLDDCPGLIQGQPSEGLLNPQEQQRFHGFIVEKRRRDWLLGRWTAKQLVQRYLAHTSGRTVALADLYIGNQEDGSPFVVDGSSKMWDDAMAHLPVSLAISHSHGYAFCALCAEQEFLEGSQQCFVLGCDLEFIEPREASFVADFFTGEEVKAITSAEPQSKDILVTATWSAKEAVLKAIRTGLRIDTRRITCRFGAAAQAPVNWEPFDVLLEEQLAGAYPGVWSAWWQIHEAFVLTLALRQTQCEQKMASTLH
jgi:4'-phosphopantetheinyl transferase